MPNKPNVVTTQVGRDAKDGKFITVEEAKRRPTTTVIETIKRKR